MVNIVMGPEGSGKTKLLIDAISRALKTESGSMVCIEKGNALTFDVDYRVRLIDAGEYEIGSYTFLRGFISGLHAGNFDITHIFIDSLYKVANCEGDIAETESFLDWCDAFGKNNNMSFTITISDDIKKATPGIEKFF